MIQEHKELLLKDLCSRLPYGIKVQTSASGGCTTEGILWNIEYNETGNFIFHKGSLLGYNINEDIIKPYLKPMSSMTKDEEAEYAFLLNDDGWGINEELVIDIIDWLNAHHFDYRGLIEKGLAIEITEENNPYED